MRNSIGSFLVVLLVILSGAAGADQSVHGYLHSTYGSIWFDGQSQCVWTSYWEVDVPECESAMVPAVLEDASKGPVPAEPKMVQESVTLFDFDRSELKALARTQLDRLAGVIARHDIRRIEIDGHTCNIGSETYNQGLSERRTASVRGYLLDRGVEDAMIVTRGYGENQPAYSNDTRENRRLNRRTETRVFAINTE